LAVLALASAPAASASAAPTATGTASPSATATSGGAGIGAPPALPGVGAPPALPGTGTPPALPFPRPTVPGMTGEIINGLAYAPAAAPLRVQELIWAGDRIRFKPYVYAGGHGKWNDVGYDCSGSVSYVLHAAGLLKTSMDSSQFATWGRGGAGQWITVYTNPGHAFIEIAGIRLDTSAEQDPNPAPGSGPRWRPVMTDTAGYLARHPSGL
jgi:cell wall-associated NlpC family hydrolase